MKILVGGDYVPRENIAQMMESGDFSYFDEIKPIIDKADFAIVNLEAPIVESETQPITKCGPNLKTSPKVIDSLRYAGVGMVTLANNHIMDYGEPGLKDTVRNLESAGILHVGTGENLKEAQGVKYVNVKDKTLAIINCCEHEFSIASESGPGANPLDPIHQYHAIQEARQKADYVLVIVHGGHEYWQLPSPRMVETYRFFVDAGADAVVNHHQHCFSGYETYKGKPILYGLGNLCFQYTSRHDSVWNYGYLTMITFDENISFEIYPYSQCNNDSRIAMLPKDYFDKEISSFNSTINDSKALSKATEEYYSRESKNIRLMFEPHIGRVSRKLFSLGLIPSFMRGNKLQKLRNSIECESHRDKLIYVFAHKF